MQTGTYNHEAALAGVQVAGYGAAAYQVAEAGVGLAEVTLALTKPSTIKLFRAVSDAEFADIAESGQFRLQPGGTEVKYFSTSRAGAQSYADQAARYSTPERLTVVEAEAPASIFQMDKLIDWLSTEILMQ